MDKQVIDTYLARGWNVIPIAKNSKIPPQGFPLETFFTRKMTEAEREQWFNHPDVDNIAVVTGKTSNLIVVDVDDLGLVQKYVTGDGASYVVKTPSGGAHLYFDYPDDYVGPAISVIEDGVELFAGRHYVLLPPSSVVSTRNGHGGAYTLVRNGTIPTLPEALNRQDFGNGVSTGKYSGPEIEEMLKFVYDHGYFRPGQHNDTIFYGSMYLIGNNVMSVDQVLDMMLDYNSKDPTPQPAEVVRTTVMRVSERYAKPYEKPTPINATPPDSSAPSGFQVLSYLDLKSLYDGYKIEWLVEGWIQSAGIMMLAAPPEHFKTWLTIDLALSVASGMPFLGEYKVSKPSKVLVVQQEDYGANLFNRYAIVEAAKLEQFPVYSNFSITPSGGIVMSMDYKANENILFHPDAMLSLDRPETFEELERIIVANGIELCIIDPFYSLTVTDDYFQTAAARIREIVKPIRNRTGCAFLFVHHMRKNAVGNGASAGDRQMAHGSQFLNAVMEGMIMMTDDQSQVPPAGSRRLMISRRFKDGASIQPEAFVFTVDTTQEDPALQYSVYRDTSPTVDVFDDVYDYVARYENGVRLSDIRHEFGLDKNAGRTLDNDPRFVKISRGTYAARE